MKYFLVATFIAATATSTANQNAIDELEIRIMKTARSEQELKEKVAAIENVRTLRLACEMQISSNRLPYSCYDGQAAMKSLNLSTESWLAKDLDQTCTRIAHVTTEMQLRKSHKLPKVCLTAAREQIQINQYKTGKVFD